MVQLYVLWLELELDYKDVFDSWIQTDLLLLVVVIVVRTYFQEALTPHLDLGNLVLVHVLRLRDFPLEFQRLQALLLDFTQPTTLLESVTDQHWFVETVDDHLFLRVAQRESNQEALTQNGLLRAADQDEALFDVVEHLLVVFLSEQPDFQRASLSSLSAPHRNLVTLYFLHIHCEEGLVVEGTEVELLVLPYYALVYPAQ